jgi:hypothetical protein
MRLGWRSEVEVLQLGRVELSLCLVVGTQTRRTTLPGQEEP